MFRLFHGLGCDSRDFWLPFGCHKAAFTKPCGAMGGERLRYVCGCGRCPMVSPRLFAAKGGWQGLSVGICVAGRQKVATLDVEDVDGEFVSDYKGRGPGRWSSM